MSFKSRLENAKVTELDHLRFSDLLNNLPAAVYVCDAEGYVVSYNEAAATLLAWSPDIGKDLWCSSWKMYDTDGMPLPWDKCPITKTLRSGKAVEDQEIIIERPNGEKLPILPHCRPLLNEEGEVTGVVIMLLDMTPRHQYSALAERTEELAKAVEALKRSEERYHRMISEVQDYGIILLSKEGFIQSWNKGAEKIKGYTEQEALGKHFHVFYTPEDQASGLPDRLISEAFRNGRAYHEGWRVKKDGTKFWGTVSITCLHNDRGEVIGFSKVTRDLTERKMSELKAEKYTHELKRKTELLRESEERYHKMVSEVEDYVIILLNPEGLIENWNKGAEKIKGFTAEEVVGKHFSIFYTEEDRIRKIPDTLLNRARVTGKALHEGWRVRKDKSTFWGNVVITALHNEQGEVIGFTKVTRDLTEKKIAEERLRVTSLKLEQKNKELERMNTELSSFAYISSHDLQEPLRKIQTFSDRIMELEYENLSEKGKDYFQRMQAGAIRMQKLIRDILAYSRATTAEKKLELADLNDLLEQSKQELEVMIAEKKAIIENNELPTLKVIPFQIHQLFTNLLNNALKFSKAETPPHVIIRAELVDAKSVESHFPVLTKQFWHIAFKDHGIGFDPAYDKKIFEVFQRLHGRTEYGGTGIGLSICKKIVENHQGCITADSTPGNGAAFHVYLPVLN
jgi:PAS domain S-box-containing protein